MRIRDFFIDGTLIAMAGGCVFIMSYLLYLGWQAEHPAPRQHWSQGPQDREPTH